MSTQELQDAYCPNPGESLTPISTLVGRQLMNMLHRHINMPVVQVEMAEE